MEPVQGESMLTITDIEDDIATLFQQIGRNIGTADDDTIVTMMEKVSATTYLVDQFAVETDEWTSFAACQEFYEALAALYATLDVYLCSN